MSALAPASVTALGPFLILAGGATFLVLLEAIVGRRRAFPWGAPALAILVLAGARLLVPGADEPSAGLAGLRIAEDGFGRFIGLLVCASGALAVLQSGPYLGRGMRVRGEYYALLLFSTAGMVLFASTTDLLVLFLGLELLSIPLYILAGYRKRDVKSNEAALKYFLLGAFSSAIFLLGIAFLYGAAGTTDLIQVIRADWAPVGLVRTGYVLLLAGFLFKVASVPFHMWTPDVYEGAPTTVTGFMATAVKAAAFGALLRVLALGTGKTPSMSLSQMLWWLAVLTMSVGNLAALTQSNVKRMLAYSSIAHAGYILVGVSVFAGTQDPEALSGILYYLLAYTFMTAGAFAVVVALGERDNEHLEMGDYSGLGWRYPALGLAMSLFMISLSGIPPTAGFFGKYLIFKNAVEHGRVGLTVIAVLNSALSVYYYLKVMVTLYMRPETVKVEAGRSAAVAAVIAVCALAVLWAGFGPGGPLPGVAGILEHVRASLPATP